MVASDRVSAFDVVMDEPIPGKGTVLTALSAFWFDRTARPGAEPPVSAPTWRDLPPELRDARPRAARGRWLLVRKRRADRHRVRRARLPGRLAAGPSTGARARWPASRCRPAWSESEQLPEPIFTPATKADSGPRREHLDARTMADLVGEELTAQLPDAQPELYAAGAELRAAARHHPGRHEVRVRLARRRADPDRRGADARLVALLAGRRLPPGRPAAEFRQAIPARLPGGHRLEQGAAATRRCPRTWSRTTAEKYREAYQRLIGDDLGSLSRHPWLARVHVTLKPVVNDPQGLAIAAASPARLRRVESVRGWQVPRAHASARRDDADAERQVGRDVPPTAGQPGHRGLPFHRHPRSRRVHQPAVNQTAPRRGRRRPSTASLQRERCPGPAHPAHTARLARRTHRQRRHSPC